MVWSLECNRLWHGMFGQLTLASHCIVLRGLLQHDHETLASLTASFYVGSCNMIMTMHACFQVKKGQLKPNSGIRPSPRTVPGITLNPCSRDIHWFAARASRHGNDLGGRRASPGLRVSFQAKPQTTNMSSCILVRDLCSNLALPQLKSVGWQRILLHCHRWRVPNNRRQESMFRGDH